MELVYITRAIRRYWWVTVLGAVLGLVAGMALGGGGVDSYVAEARVLVAPPSDAGFGSTSNDRYVQNQLLVLDSEAIAVAVAEEIGDISAAEVRSAATFEQIPGSDILFVTVTASTPELARDIANGYVDAYFRASREQLDDAQEPDLAAINDAIGDVEEALATVDARIEEVMAPYVNQPAAVEVPTVDQVSPTLDTERQALLDQYFQLLFSRNEMTLGAQTRVATQVVQRATLPTAPTSAGMSLLLVAGPVAGLMLGGLASVALARTSNRILDEDEAEDVLGMPVAARVARDRGLAAPRHDLVGPTPEKVVGTIHELCVRAEASAVSGPALTVVVGGADESAGSTTVALAMARHFAGMGSQVLLVDADTSDPELTTLAGEGVSGVRMLLSDDPARTSPSGRTDRNRPRHPYMRTGVNGLRFSGLGEVADAHGIRRQDASTLLERASEHAQVVVVDAGVLMDAAANVALAQLADVVVLTMPAKRQRRSTLEVTIRQLSSRGALLPVMTGAGTGKHRATPRPTPTETSDAPSEVEVASR
ncbi:hypothetical protein [Actinomarinicola tropica]|uniref:CobQ/CobB/MinD/ParA nucleotide binding domain-containing protein n=1 Tax=Actinomarinicola tropica TaxID=2789776 RepID=A0A5Q2RQ28_9ACTN|nr:hypothetical protein [Actinomarinicola tropica]QGG96000.1 hypothetical protein GH723_13330 [Actinomarinicola tropica]